MEFSRQEDWSGLPCPPPGDLPDLGIKSGSPALLFEGPLPAKVAVEVLVANPRPAHWYGSYFVIIMSVVTLNALFFLKYL